MNHDLINLSQTPYVTTPPEVYFLNHTSSNYCSILIDRISLSGIFHAEQNYTKLKENHWRQIKELDGRPLIFELDRVNENGEFQQIATLIRGKYKANNWRVDTSNHIKTEKEKKYISNILALFDKPHVTRLDIAIDFINSEHAGMNHKIFKPSTTTTIRYNRAGQIETIYCGNRKSDIQYRYYDKKIEFEKQHKEKVPININNWERLELQLRNKKAVDNWKKETLKMLDYFKRPNLTTIEETDPKSFYMLTGIIKHPEYFNDLAKGTKAKYRKLIKNNRGFDVSLSDKARKVLISKADSIQQELDSFFISASNNKTKTDQTPNKDAQSATKINYIEYDGFNIDYQCKTLQDILRRYTGKPYIITFNLKALIKAQLENGLTLYDFESAINYLIKQGKTISIKDLASNLPDYLSKINSN
ncbi:replication initiation factor domain-containing protein [Lactobacillus helveticus]|uniref:replication initiation factor domain-containing protein n=1 Tax=Lactobacillus helveticus TaxID=1587 RepID=UPI0015678910|nr:replication initiation factor domain-containing protein [Lactobacillus helveticus]NRO16936.1 Replication initiation protein [Lactobacillus helveticus]